MSFFNKVKGSAMSFASKGMQILSNVKSAAVEFTNTNTPSNAIVIYPEKEIVLLFNAILEIIDTLANNNEPFSNETDQKLQNSKIKFFITKIIGYIQVETETWMHDFHNAEINEFEDSKMPCIDLFLSTHFVNELVNRGLLDRPKGCLPLILSIISYLLRSINYPLLPHQTIYKPISKLISNAMRYDAVHNNATIMCTNGVYNKVEYSNYKRRIGECQ